ncbi:hypothetical protein Dimus_022251 [Dionaea muscipula]
MHFTQILSESGKISKSKWQMVTTRTATGDHQRPPSPPSPVSSLLCLHPFTRPLCSLSPNDERTRNDRRRTPAFVQVEFRLHDSNSRVDTRETIVYILSLCR